MKDNVLVKEAQFQRSLYEKHKKVYPREVHGLFAFLRVLAGSGLLGLYYILPWIKWGDHQIVLFDLPARKFHILGTAFWPQDFLFLAFILLIAAFSLFFFTALAGRLWCGYACPQTVWTELFLWIERKIEGRPAKQKKLDKSKLTTEKIIKKASKHFLWLAVSFVTAFTFVSYFTPSNILINEILYFDLGPWEITSILFFTFTTYANAGWMREQVCMYMCPYARFQSVMFDGDTLTISYDSLRGEPRGARNVSSGHQSQGLGDCIDCKLCVQVCPTGIDIRNGLQYECIGCSACIDACNGVMDKIGYPLGLIRYTTENAVSGKRHRIIRPRIIIYALLLATLLGITAYSLTHRVPLGLDVIRDRNQLYRDVGDLIENVYTLKIINMDEDPHTYRLEAAGIMGLTMVDKDVITVDAGSVQDKPVRLRAHENNLRERSTQIMFKLTALDDVTLSISEEARFLGPAL